MSEKDETTSKVRSFWKSGFSGYYTSWKLKLKKRIRAWLDIDIEQAHTEEALALHGARLTGMDQRVTKQGRTLALWRDIFGEHSVAATDVRMLGRENSVIFILTELDGGRVFMQSVHLGNVEEVKRTIKMIEDACKPRMNVVDVPHGLDWRQGQDWRGYSARPY